MSSREAFLEEVRRSLGRKAGTPVPPPPPVRLRIVDQELQDRVARFGRALEGLTASLWIASDGPSARARVEQITQRAPALAAAHRLLEECAIPSLPGVTTAPDGEPALREAAAQARYGITSAEFALADTGTLVFLAGPGSPRMISLLPPIHIAVIGLDQVLTGLDELFTLVPNPAGVASSMVLVTGSSRTGDIEQILVPGVHGPGKLHVVLIAPDLS